MAISAMAILCDAEVNNEIVKKLPSQIIDDDENYYIKTEIIRLYGKTENHINEKHSLSWESIHYG